MEAASSRRRWGAAGGIAFVVLVIVAVAVAGDQPGGGSTDRTIRAFYADSGNRGGVLAQAYLAALAGACMLVFLGSLRAALRSAGERGRDLAALAFAAGIVVTTMVMAAFAVRALVAASYQFGDEFARGPLDPQLVRLFDNLAYWLGIVFASVAGAVMIAAATAAGKESRALGRVGSAGYAAAALTATGLFFPGGVVVLMVWIALAAIALLRGTAQGLPEAKLGTSSASRSGWSSGTNV